MLINLNYIKELIKCNDSDNDPDKMHILDALFYETRRIVQYREGKRITEDNNDELYAIYKEMFLVIC